MWNNAGIPKGKDTPVFLKHCLNSKEVLYNHEHAEKQANMPALTAFEDQEKSERVSVETEEDQFERDGSGEETNPEQQQPKTQ